MMVLPRPGCAAPSKNLASREQARKYLPCPSSEQTNRRASLCARWLFCFLLFPCSGKGSVLAGLSHERLVHATGVEPLRGQQNAFAQVYLRLVAQLAARFLDTVAVIAAEHERAQLCHDGLCVGEASDDLLGDNAAVVDGQVGQVQGGPFAADGIGDGI